MSFVPPRCANVSCSQHTQPEAGSYCRQGFYQPRCRAEPVPRFRCRACEHGFSRQTFRHDYRDRRPECNAPLFVLPASGVGLRQADCNLDLDVRAVLQKMIKIARTCGVLHRNLSPSLPAGRCYVMDEEETYEAASIRPLTMPSLIEKETWFVVATAVGRIRRQAPDGSARRRRQEADERKHGRRSDQSNRRVRDVLQDLARRVEGDLVLRSDQKASYATIAKAVFGDRVCRETTAASPMRTTCDTLSSIDTTLAAERHLDSPVQRVRGDHRMRGAIRISAHSPLPPPLFHPGHQFRLDAGGAAREAAERSPTHGPTDQVTRASRDPTAELS